MKLTKAKWDGKALFRTCTNGSSEFVTNVSMSLVSMLYNFQLMKYAGENGIAAYGVIMYVNFIFIAIFIGYSIGTAPIIGYNYGAQNESELKNIFKKSMILVTIAGIVLTGIGILLARPLSSLFVGYDTELCDMTTHAFALYCVSFLVAGFSIFGSSLFTALNNGLVSAIISFMRTLVFQVICIMILPGIWGMEGIWYSIIVSEVMAAGVALVLIAANKKKYRY